MQIARQKREPAVNAGSLFHSRAESTGASAKTAYFCVS